MDPTSSKSIAEQLQSYIPELGCFSTDLIAPYVDTYLPPVAECVGSIAGSIFPCTTMGLSIGQFAADKIVGNGDAKKWKSVCMLTTLSALVGITLFGPSFFGQWLVYGAIGGILGGMQGLKAVGKDIPSDYIQKKVMQYISAAAAIVAFVKTHGLPLVRSLPAQV